MGTNIDHGRAVFGFGRTDLRYLPFVTVAFTCPSGVTSPDDEAALDILTLGGFQ